MIIKVYCAAVVWILLIGCGIAVPVKAQPPAEFDLEDVDVSYIYAAVMGSGSYKIDGRRITMLRLPFSWTQRPMTEEQKGIKWYLPVIVGNDSVEGSDWFDELFPDNLVTLTIMPGFEYQLPISPRWTLKPFAYAGVTHDFVTDEVVLLGVAGLSSLTRFDLDEDWELRWGNKLRFAAEHQVKSDFRTNFGIFETGFDLRRGTGWMVYGREVDVSSYYRFQHYIPEWDATSAPDRQSELENVHELGFSVGLKKPRKLFGITFNRVRLGYKKGGDIRGFTIGGEFPF